MNTEAEIPLPSPENPLAGSGTFGLTMRYPKPSYRHTKDGAHYHVTFELSQEEWEYFNDPGMDLAGMVVEGHMLEVTHRAEPKALLGQFCKQAVFLCQAPDFAEYLNTQYSVPPGMEFDTEDSVGLERWTKLIVCQHCKIKSRKELDVNPEANKLWQELHAAYRVWVLEDGL